MIPKNIFFIWFGDILPAYVNFSINSFKQMNPDFNIIFLNYTIKKLKSIFYDNKITNIYDQILLNSIHIIFNNSKYTYFLKTNLELYKNNFRFLQLLSDIYRLELINNIGGIYVDCDTFPIKPFDSKLLSKKHFFVRKHFFNGFKTFLCDDNYFFGGNGKTSIDSYNNKFIFKLIQTTDKWWSNIKFLSQKKKFLKTNILLGEYSLSKYFYIEHYCNNSWKNTASKKISIPKCFLDYKYKLFN